MSDEPAIERPVFRCGVREMVDFVHRRGDLAGAGGFRAPNRALEGTRLHRRLQKKRGPECEAEVSVEFRCASSEIEAVLAGRVDLLRRGGQTPLVEEIKSVDRFWNGRADPLHVAQLRVYGAILAAQNGWDAVELHLTHVDLETDLETTIPFQETAASLEAFFQETLRVWMDWLAEQSRWRRMRDDSLGRMEFPFSTYRSGQRELARSVYRSIRDGRNLFVEAPTGLGKTLATLFPAVKALPILGDGRVFFLTAKTPGRLAANEALAKLRRSGARLRSTTLTAKNKICFTTDPGGCDPRACPYALGYHDRIRPALRELLGRESIDRATVEEVARTHGVCPFELSLDASAWSDVVVGDFNHLFDPSSRLRRHFGEDSPRHVVLVDEAHNLVERSRDMHSATLHPRDLVVQHAAQKAKGGAVARRALKAAAAALEDFKPEVGAPPHHDDRFAFAEIPGSIFQACRAAASALEKVLVSLRPGTGLSGWIEPWFQLNSWLRAAESFDESCRLIRAASGEATIFCADPSSRLRGDLKNLRAAVFFSATLSPGEYFRELLGGTPEDGLEVFDSPFDPGQMRLRVLPRDVTFKGRSASLPDVARDVVAHFREVQGNHLVFCPSMAYLADLLAGIETHAPDLVLLVQSPGMDEAGRGEFLARFQPGAHLLALAVMGGIFGEGIDLPGDRLNGVTVIGTGLPGISLERDLLREHFETTRGDGFDFACRFPGMQRVLQAVGRLIRTENDTGSVLLIDRRFTEPRQRRLFPRWWRVEPPV